MKAHCESIRHLVGRSSLLLQDLLAASTWSHGGGGVGDISVLSSQGSSPSASPAPPNERHLSQKMIELISDLSTLSLQANSIYAENRKRDKETVKCMEHLRNLVQKQHEEISKLSTPKPLVCEIAVDTSELTKSDHEREVKKEEEYKKQIEHLTGKIFQLKDLMEKSLRENKRLKASLSKCTMLLKTQQALLEEYEMTQVRYDQPYSRVALDIFADDHKGSRHGYSNIRRDQIHYTHTTPQEYEEEDELNLDNKLHKDKKEAVISKSDQNKEVRKFKISAKNKHSFNEKDAFEEQHTIKSPPKISSQPYRYQNEAQHEEENSIDQSGDHSFRSNASVDTSGVMESFDSEMTASTNGEEINQSNNQNETETAINDEQHNLSGTVESLPPPPPPPPPSSPSHHEEEILDSEYERSNKNNNTSISTSDHKDKEEIHEKVDIKDANPSSIAVEIDSPNHNISTTGYTNESLTFSHESFNSADKERWKQDGNVEDSFMLIQEYYDPNDFEEAMAGDESYISSPERHYDEMHQSQESYSYQEYHHDHEFESDEIN